MIERDWLVVSLKTRKLNKMRWAEFMDLVYREDALLKIPYETDEEKARYLSIDKSGTLAVSIVGFRREKHGTAILGNYQNSLRVEFYLTLKPDAPFNRKKQFIIRRL